MGSKLADAAVRLSWRLDALREAVGRSFRWSWRSLLGRRRGRDDDRARRRGPIAGAERETVGGAGIVVGDVVEEEVVEEVTGGIGGGVVERGSNT